MIKEVMRIVADLGKICYIKSITLISRDKKAYGSWEAFSATCIHQTAAAPEYNLLRLKNYLKRTVLQIADSLGDSWHWPEKCEAIKVTGFTEAQSWNLLENSNLRIKEVKNKKKRARLR